MANARERLTNLVELASQSAPEKQRALAVELCDLLLDWPEDYSRSMRAPFEALLEKVVRGLDVGTRRTLAARLAASTDTPVDLLNEFFFDVATELKSTILARNAEANDDNAATVANHDTETSFVETWRTHEHAGLADVLSRFLDIDVATAEHILGDESAEALAVACKGAHLARATYSTLAVLANGKSPDSIEASYARLAAIDAIPEAGAERMLNFWRVRRETVHTPEPRLEAVPL